MKHSLFVRELLVRVLLAIDRSARLRRVSIFYQRSQQFVRDNVLHVHDGGDEEEAAAQRDLRQCPTHEVVDRAINDAERDSVFEAVVEEDDNVSIRHNPVSFIATKTLPALHRYVDGKRKY